MDPFVPEFGLVDVHSGEHASLIDFKPPMQPTMDITLLVFWKPSSKASMNLLDYLNALIDVRKRKNALPVIRLVGICVGDDAVARKRIWKYDGPHWRNFEHYVLHPDVTEANFQPLEWRFPNIVGMNNELGIINQGTSWVVQNYSDTGYFWFSYSDRLDMDNDNQEDWGWELDIGQDENDDNDDDDDVVEVIEVVRDVHDGDEDGGSNMVEESYHG